MRARSTRFALFMAVSALTMCAAHTFSDKASAAVSGPEAASRAREVLSNRCFRCHGANGAARKNVFVLDRNRLLSSKIVIPGQADSLLLQVVETGAMPFGGPKLAEQERTALRDWVLAGAPDWEDGRPPVSTFISESAILRLINQDLSNSDERARPYLRYFSFAHLHNARVPAAELRTYREALSKLINSLSWSPQVTSPSAIDPAQSIFRIDLRDYNWTAATWSAVLALYPYSAVTDEAVPILERTGVNIPYVRADWFVASASASPLYHQVLGLPATAQELERQLGVDVLRNIAEEKNVVRGGVRNSGVSRNNRVLERHISTHGAYWKSYDFRGSLDEQSIFKNPLIFRPAGGEIIFNLPNGLQAYFLAGPRGERLDRAPVNIVADHNNPDSPIVQNGRSCMSCHYDGIQLFKDNVREVVSATSLVSFDREKALAIYPEQSRLNKLFASDAARFRNAIDQAGVQRANSALTEPINALYHRYIADLSVEEAAAETGMDEKQFQARVSRNERLISLGYGQLTVSNGGMKRDIWERHFGDLARELELGANIPPRVIRTAFQPVPVTRNSLIPGAAGPLSNPSEALRGARTIFIMSRSGYFHADDLAGELAKRALFQQTGIAITKDRNEADLVIDVDRAVFTTEFPYSLIDRRTNTVVAAGRVNSLFGTVAGKIANELMRKLEAAWTGSVERGFSPRAFQPSGRS